MKRLKFRLGPADARTKVRCIDYIVDGKIRTESVPAPAREIALELEDGTKIEDATFYDMDAKGNRSVRRNLMGSHIVGPDHPLIAGSCVYEGQEDVDPEPETGEQDPVEDPTGDEETESTTEETNSESEADESKTPVDEEKSAEKSEDEEGGDQDAEGGEPEDESDSPQKSEAQSIRDFLNDNPEGLEVANRDVIAALDKQGIKVTSSQVTRQKKKLAE